MADVLETIDKTETLLIIAAIGVGVYLLYQAGGSFADWIDKLTGASAENTYGNAAAQSVQHPIATVGTIGGGWIDDVKNWFSPDKTLPSEISSTGYMKIGASGQHWSCTGPQGAANDSCTPVTIDANGNATISGPGVQAVNAN
jgi:hypothetical protein